MVNDDRLAAIRVYIQDLKNDFDNTDIRYLRLVNAFERLDYALSNQGRLPYDWRWARGER